MKLKKGKTKNKPATQQSKDHWVAVLSLNFAAYYYVDASKGDRISLN